MTTRPTTILARVAADKALQGDKRAQAVVNRWIVDCPEIIQAALSEAISAKLGYTDDIVVWAEENLGIKLYSAQRRMVEAILNGERIVGGRGAGRSTARRVARAWMEREK